MVQKNNFKIIIPKRKIDEATLIQDFLPLPPSNPPVSAAIVLPLADDLFFSNLIPLLCDILSIEFSKTQNAIKKIIKKMRKTKDKRIKFILSFLNTNEVDFSFLDLVVFCWHTKTNLFFSNIFQHYNKFTCSDKYNHFFTLIFTNVSILIEKNLVCPDVPQRKNSFKSFFKKLIGVIERSQSVPFFVCVKKLRLRPILPSLKIKSLPVLKSTKSKQYEKIWKSYVYDIDGLCGCFNLGETAFLEKHVFVLSLRVPYNKKKILSGKKPIYTKDGFKFLKECESFSLGNYRANGINFNVFLLFGKTVISKEYLVNKLFLHIDDYVNNQMSNTDLQCIFPGKTFNKLFSKAGVLDGITLELTGKAINSFFKTLQKKWLTKYDPILFIEKFGCKLEINSLSKVGLFFDLNGFFDVSLIYNWHVDICKCLFAKNSDHYIGLSAAPEFLTNFFFVPFFLENCKNLNGFTNLLIRNNTTNTYTRNFSFEKINFYNNLVYNIFPPAFRKNGMPILSFKSLIQHFYKPGSKFESIVKKKISNLRIALESLNSNNKIKTAFRCEVTSMFLNVGSNFKLIDDFCDLDFFSFVNIRKIKNILQQAIQDFLLLLQIESKCFVSLISLIVTEIFFKEPFLRGSSNLHMINPIAKHILLELKNNREQTLKVYVDRVVLKIINNKENCKYVITKLLELSLYEHFNLQIDLPPILEILFDGLEVLTEKIFDFYCIDFSLIFKVGKEFLFSSNLRAEECVDASNYFYKLFFENTNKFILNSNFIKLVKIGQFMYGISSKDIANRMAQFCLLKKITKLYVVDEKTLNLKILKVVQITNSPSCVFNKKNCILYIEKSISSQLSLSASKRIPYPWTVEDFGRLIMGIQLYTNPSNKMISALCIYNDIRLCFLGLRTITSIYEKVKYYKKFKGSLKTEAAELYAQSISIELIDFDFIINFYSSQNISLDLQEKTYLKKLLAFDVTNCLTTLQFSDCNINEKNLLLENNFFASHKFDVNDLEEHPESLNNNLPDEKYAEFSEFDENYERVERKLQANLENSESVLTKDVLLIEKQGVSINESLVNVKNKEIVTSSILNGNNVTVENPPLLCTSSFSISHSSSKTPNILEDVQHESSHLEPHLQVENNTLNLPIDTKGLIYDEQNPNANIVFAPRITKKYRVDLNVLYNVVQNRNCFFDMSMCNTYVEWLKKIAKKTTLGVFTKNSMHHALWSFKKRPLRTEWDLFFSLMFYLEIFVDC